MPSSKWLLVGVLLVVASIAVEAQLRLRTVGNFGGGGGGGGLDSVQCPAGSSPDPNFVFCEDFESGVPSWSGFTGSWSVTTSSPAFGAQSLQIAYGAAPCSGDSCAGGGYGVFNTSQLTSFHLRWYEKFASGWVFSSIATKGWQLRPPSAGWDLYALNDLWNQGTRLSATQTPYAEYPQNTNLPAYNWKNTLNTWTLVEIYVSLNTVGSANGTFQMWVDETLKSSYTNVEYRDTTEGVDSFMLSAYWNCNSGDCTLESRSAQNRFVDNVAVTTGNNYIGPNE